MSREYRYQQELKNALEKQARLWNEYYIAVNQKHLATACVSKDGDSVEVLSVPKIEGRAPTRDEQAQCVQAMLGEGFCTLDCLDPLSFRVTSEGVVFPVNFSGVVAKPEAVDNPTAEDVHAEARYAAFECTVRACSARVSSGNSPKSTGSNSPRMNGNAFVNTGFLEKLCAKAQTKVHNRWFFGIAGKRVQVGNKSYVVPGHLADAIKDNQNKVSSLKPDDFKRQLLLHLKQSANRAVKSSTSRDVWTQKLYNGKYASGSNPAAFFDTMIADDQPKQAAVPEVSGPTQRLTS